MDLTELSDSSSRGAPLDNLEPALVDMTEALIPNYSAEIQNTNPADLEPILAQLTTIALTTPLKDKALSGMLGKMAIVMSAQLRHSSRLMDQMSAKLKGHQQQLHDMQEENQNLKHELAKTQQALTRAEKDIDYLVNQANTSQIDGDGAAQAQENANLLISKCKASQPPPRS